MRPAARAPAADALPTRPTLSMYGAAEDASHAGASTRGIADAAVAEAGL
jgi:hypothetical protein